jgi:hypothetical protein
MPAAPTVAIARDAEPARFQTELLRNGPYRVVFERLQRLVSYRDQLLEALQTDRANQKTTAELIRVRHMIREAHRAVSINAEAKLLAQRIDPGEPPLPAMPAPGPLLDT